MLLSAAMEIQCMNLGSIIKIEALFVSFFNEQLMSVVWENASFFTEFAIHVTKNFVALMFYVVVRSVK